MKKLAAVAVLMVVAGCGASPGSDENAALQERIASLEAQASQAAASSAAPAASAAAPAASAPVAEAASSTEAVDAAGETVDFTMPDVVGMNLQDAQDLSQTFGIFYTTSHDLRFTRSQLLDSNWQVCDQNISAGTPVQGGSELEGSIDFGAVKLDETCP